MRVIGESRDKMLAILGDGESQKILSLIVREPRTTSGVATELSLPLSTVYRKMGMMRQCGLLLVERYLVGGDGKREALYTNAFSEIRFRPESDGVGIEVTLSQKALEKKWVGLLFRPGEGPDWQP